MIKRYLLTLALLLLCCNESTQDVSCHPNADDDCDFDGDGVNNVDDPFPRDNTLASCNAAGYECGTSESGYNCGDCNGSTEYCTDHQCVDDCPDMECGESPVFGFNCGTCSGATEYCQDHECIDDCEGLECGESPLMHFECGTCDELEMCDENSCVRAAWVDETSGLMWESNASDNEMSWFEADNYCNRIIIADLNGWRLPSLEELLTLFRGCVNGEATGDLSRTTCTTEYLECTTSACWTASNCDNCDSLQGPGIYGCYWPPELTGTCSEYWTSTPASYSWDYKIAEFSVVDFMLGLNSYERYVRCVRDNDTLN